MIWILLIMSLFAVKSEYFKFIGYQPEPIQWRIHKAMTNYRFVMVKGGNRSGKSFTAGCEGSVHIHKPGSDIWCVAPTYTLTDKLFGYVRKYGIDATRLPLKSDRMRPQPYIETAIDTRLWGKSTEKISSLEAESVSLMLIDEFGYMNKIIWNRLVARLDRDDSRCLIIFTPKGKNVWVRQFWNEKENDPNWFTLTMPTYKMKHVSRQFLEDAERELGGKDDPAYREQMGGEFVPYGTLIYPMFGEHNIKTVTIDKTWAFRIGIDVGYVHPTTASFWAISKGEKCHQFGEYHKTFTTERDNAIAIIERMAGYMQLYDFPECIIYFPPEEPGFAVELRRAAGKYNFDVMVTPANNAVEDGIEMVRRLLPTQITFDPTCKNTIFNYQNYSHKPDSEKIQKINDDHADADRYCLYSHFKQSADDYYTLST